MKHSAVRSTLVVALCGLVSLVLGTLPALYAGTGPDGAAPLAAPRSSAVGLLPMARQSPLEPGGMYVAALRLARSPSDTIKFRVCKDLSICYLEFGAPQVGVVPAPSLPPVGMLALTPLPVPVVPEIPAIAARPGAGWLALGVPLFIGAFVPHSSGTPGEGGSGGGGPPPPPPPPPPPVEVTPEPATVLLLLTGLAGIGALSLRRRRA